MSYPLAYDAYFESKISAFSPVNGVLEATPGKKTVFELHIPEGKTAVSASTTNGNSDIKMKKQERIIMYEYTVSSDKDDALNIYVDGKAAFSYRIVSVPRMDTVAAAKKEN